MENLVYLIGPVGCAVGMAVCMAMMARGMRRTNHDQPVNDEVAALRAEVAQLREERDATVGGRRDGARVTAAD